MTMKLNQNKWCLLANLPADYLKIREYERQAHANTPLPVPFEWFPIFFWCNLCVKRMHMKIYAQICSCSQIKFMINEFLLVADGSMLRVHSAKIWHFSHLIETKGKFKFLAQYTIVTGDHGSVDMFFFAAKIDIHYK